MEMGILKGARRSRVGTIYARRLRAGGRLPAVIYGHGQDPEAIALPAHDVQVHLAHGAHVLQVDLDDRPSQYLIKAVQYDHLGTTPIHLDLMRVHVNEVVTVQVGIELRGVPRGVSDGGALEQLIDELEIKCLVAQIPEVLHANVSDLGVGDSILVSDLEMPEGVTPVLTTDARVATVRLLAEEVEAKAEGEEGEVAQPEVIGRARKEEGEEAGGGT